MSDNYNTVKQHYMSGNYNTVKQHYMSGNYNTVKQHYMSGNYNTVKPVQSLTLYKSSTCLVRTQKLVPMSFSLDRCHCI